MTGKLADTVMSVRNGEQIARKYQPSVYNPNTQAQVAVRAKLKLLSQLSAVMAPAIAIPRKGTVSSRNLFTKKNYLATTYNNSRADIALLNVQLTDSVVGMPAISASRGTSFVTASIATPYTGLNASRVVYAMFEKGADNSLRLVGSEVVNQKGDGTWPATTLPNVPGECVVYAYAVRDNTDAARVAFGNLTTATAESVAKLIVTRSLTESDITLTETVATSIDAVE